MVIVASGMARCIFGFQVDGLITKGTYKREREGGGRVITGIVRCFG